MEHYFRDKFIELGVSIRWSDYLDVLIWSTLLVIVSWGIHWLIRRLIKVIFRQLSERTRTKFDDFMVSRRVPLMLAFIPPLIIAYEAVSFIFEEHPVALVWVNKGLNVFAVTMTLSIIRRVLKTMEDYLKTKPKFGDKPIDSFIQVFMIFAWLIGGLSILAIVTEIKFWQFFTTLGAASAIVILVFKDTILGFVASIQVSINDMVRIGDWITFDSYGADGDVMEINLATVKVQNFDNTITTIPTYALISDSFRNWRGMMDSGGRRIKRVVWISQKSIRFLSGQEIEELKNISLIRPYLDKRGEEIRSENLTKNIDKSVLINGRNFTNLGVFRKYIFEYLQKHAALNHEMPMMVRHLAPTPQGLPLEIYCFSKDKKWENYEYIQADIFDHVMAAAKYFKLDLFEFSSEVVKVD